MNSRTNYFLTKTAKILYGLVAVALLLVVLSQPANVQATEKKWVCQSIVFDRYFLIEEIKSQQAGLSYFGSYFRLKNKLNVARALRKNALVKNILITNHSNQEKNIFSKAIQRELAIEQPDKAVEVVMTAYTSTPDQTDDTPFIAASGKRVYDGMIAANWLPFGTKIKIPELYGDKIFTIDDRMNSRYGYGRMDIWLDTTKAEARKFGVKRLAVEIYYEKEEIKQLVLAK